MKAEWEYLGSGRNRAVFRHGNYVVKVPLNVAGIHDNLYERDTWLRYGQNRGYIKYARCRLFKNFSLIMQFARFSVEGKTGETGFVPYSSLKGANEWGLTVDCQQVGYNRFGQLVAYDYGRY